MGYLTVAEGRIYGLPMIMINVDDTQIQAAIDAACDLVDGYLAQAGITTPLVNPDDNLKRRTWHIALWYLATQVNAFDNDNTKNHPIYINYEHTLKWLQTVADGESVANLGGGAGSGGGNSPTVPSLAPSVSNNRDPRGW